MKRKNETGFTLVEMIVVTALLATIVAAAGGAINVMLKSTQVSNDQGIALRQVQNAGYWITRDALMAQNVATDEPGIFLSLSWVDWDGNVYDVSYVLNDNKLKRELNGAATLIAEYIHTDSTANWDPVERKLTVTIRASFNGTEVERKYEATPRPSA